MDKKSSLTEQEQLKEILKKLMVQQTLHQNITYTRKRSHSLCESIAERSLMNDARVTGIITQISYNTQKIKKTSEDKEILWKEVSGKKKNWNSPKKTTLRKQSKIDSY
jgi:hypothetical protein